MGLLTFSALKNTGVCSVLSHIVLEYTLYPEDQNLRVRKPSQFSLQSLKLNLHLCSLKIYVKCFFLYTAFLLIIPQKWRKIIILSTGHSERYVRKSACQMELIVQDLQISLGYKTNIGVL